MTFLLFLISLGVLEYIVRARGGRQNRLAALAKRQAERPAGGFGAGPNPGVVRARPSSGSAWMGGIARYHGKDPGSTPSSADRV